MNIIKEIKKDLNLNYDDGYFSQTPNLNFGDYSLTVSFNLAKKQKKDPKKIAKDIYENLKPKGIVKEIKLFGPYINLYLDWSKVLSKLNLPKFKRKKDKIMVEFSQPNTHKAFHVGHIRSTLVGHVISNILSVYGYNVVRANYSGDKGIHVAKCLWDYLKFHKNEQPTERKGEFLGKLYSEANKLLEKNKEYENEVKDILHKLEDNNDKELISLWKKTKKWSVNEFKKIYNELDVEFDKWFWESSYEKPGKKLVKQMLKKGIAYLDNGAPVINLSKYNLPNLLLLRSDGTALYSTKDLALAKDKFEKFNIDISIYVVGAEQKLYLKQIFATLKEIGFKQAEKCIHIPFELVRFKDKKMSSRTGDVITYWELRDKMYEKALREIKKRNTDKDDRLISKVALDVALAAMKYQFIKIDTNKNIIFDWENALSLEGNTAPYILYSGVRAIKILKKYKQEIKKPKNLILDSNEEKQLVNILSKIYKTIENAAKNYSPHIIANYAYDLSVAFSKFYDNCKVIGSKNEKTRIYLVKVFYEFLSFILNLIGMKVPEFM